MLDNNWPLNWMLLLYPVYSIKYHRFLKRAYIYIVTVLINNLLSERSKNFTDAEEDPHCNLQHLNCVEEQNQDFICMPAGSIALRRSSSAVV